MRKVLFTEEQMRKILAKEGLESGLDIGGGYLDPDDGSEAPVNASGVETFADPTNNEKDHVVTGDRIAHSKKPGNGRYGFNARNSYCCVMQEDIDAEKYTYSKQQQANAGNTGTKMGQNIANNKNVSDGTQRKRKYDLEKQQKKLGRYEFQKKYGPIAKMVKSSLTQMSNSNKAKNNTSDLGQLNDVNDVTKAKTSVGKGHNKDGEQLNNGVLHYFN